MSRRRIRKQVIRVVIKTRRNKKSRFLKGGKKHIPHLFPKRGPH